MYVYAFTIVCYPKLKQKIIFPEIVAYFQVVHCNTAYQKLQALINNFCMHNIVNMFFIALTWYIVNK